MIGRFVIHQVRIVDVARGVIEADLMLLDNNPLDDLNALRKPSLVVKEGETISRKQCRQGGKDEDLPTRAKSS